MREAIYWDSSHRKKKTLEVADIVVYPRLVSLNPIQLPRRDFFGNPGASSPIEDPVYIHGTRDYQCWRPARTIHWKASARHNRLMEKVCEPAQREKILIVVRVDRFADDPTGKSFESCLEVAASLAVQLDRLRYSVGLATNGRSRNGVNAAVKIARNPGQLSDLLEAMARLEPVPAGDMIDILRRGSTLPWGITSVCFTFAMDVGNHALNHYLGHRNIPVITVVCDPMAETQAADNRAVEAIYRLDSIRKSARENA